MIPRSCAQRGACLAAFAAVLVVPSIVLADAVTLVETTDYMHARYYSSNLGRFLSVDPVGGNTGSSQSWNRYSYVENNPIVNVDPTGRKKLTYLARMVNGAYRVVEKKVAARIAKANAGQHGAVVVRGPGSSKKSRTMLKELDPKRGAKTHNKGSHAKDSPHVQSKSGKKKIYIHYLSAALTAAGEMVAPRSSAAGNDSDSTPVDVLVAAQADLLTALDPTGMTNEMIDAMDEDRSGGDGDPPNSDDDGGD